MVDAIQKINDLDLTKLTASGSNQVENNQFVEILDKLNNDLVHSETLLQDLATGKTSNIHHVMLQLEDAKLSFQMLVQVRNKVLEGYQELLRMQV